MEATHRQLSRHEDRLVVTFALPPAVSFAYGATYRVETMYDPQRVQAAMLRRHADSIRDADMSTSALEPEQVLGPIIPGPDEELERFQTLNIMTGQSFLCGSFTVTRQNRDSDDLTVLDCTGATDVTDGLCSFENVGYVI